MLDDNEEIGVVWVMTKNRNLTKSYSNFHETDKVIIKIINLMVLRIILKRIIITKKKVISNQFHKIKFD